VTVIAFRAARVVIATSAATRSPPARYATSYGSSRETSPGSPDGVRRAWLRPVPHGAGRAAPGRAPPHTCLQLNSLMGAGKPVGIRRCRATVSGERLARWPLGRQVPGRRPAATIREPGDRPAGRQLPPARIGGSASSGGHSRRGRVHAAGGRRMRPEP
jgi:hypothetical protein